MNAKTLERIGLRRLGLMVLACSVAVGVPCRVMAQDPVDPVEEAHRLAGYHGVVIEGVGQFTVESTESITAVPGEWKRDRSGRSTLPITIVGMAGRGHAEGIGETVYWLDKSRPVEGSGVRAKSRGAAFPAVQEMRFHIFLVTEALPGRTFRSINPAVMVNDNATAFPPRLGSRYNLQSVVEMEDVNEPGVVVVRIVSNHNQIVGAGRERWNPAPHPEQN